MDSNAKALHGLNETNDDEVTLLMGATLGSTDLELAVSVDERDALSNLVLRADLICDRWLRA